MKLSKRTRVVLTTLIFGGTIVFVAYLAYLAEKGYIDIVCAQAEAQLSGTTESISAGIHRYLEERAQCLKIFSDNQKVREAANKSLLVEKATDVPSVFLDFYHTQKSSIHRLDILDEKGVVVCNIPYRAENIHADLSEMAGVGHVLQEHQLHITGTVDPDSGVPAISILAPITFQGEFAGMARWMIHTETVFKRFSGGFINDDSGRDL